LKADVGTNPLFVVRADQSGAQTSSTLRGGCSVSQAGSRRERRKAEGFWVKPVEAKRRTPIQRLDSAENTTSRLEAYPITTDPSICNWISRFVSTAYSIGGSLTRLDEAVPDHRARFVLRGAAHQVKSCSSPMRLTLASCPTLTSCSAISMYG
jgi:hypothetical protein